MRAGHGTSEIGTNRLTPCCCFIVYPVHSIGPHIVPVCVSRKCRHNSGNWYYYAYCHFWRSPSVLSEFTGDFCGQPAPQKNYHYWPAGANNWKTWSVKIVFSRLLAMSRHYSQPWPSYNRQYTVVNSCEMLSRPLPRRIKACRSRCSAARFEAHGRRFSNGYVVLNSCALFARASSYCIKACKWCVTQSCDRAGDLCCVF